MFKAPSHSYFVALVVGGIRAEARAASITEACRYAHKVLSENRKANATITNNGKHLVDSMVHHRRKDGRGAHRSKISEPGIGTIELTMDAPPKGWSLKDGPKTNTLWQSIPAGRRWK